MTEREQFNAFATRLQGLVSEYQTSHENPPSRLSLTVTDYNGFFDAQGRCFEGDKVLPAQVPDELLATLNTGTKEEIQSALAEHLPRLLGVSTPLQLTWGAEETKVE